MKKINGISLLHGIAILSGIGVVGIFAWCNESINEGGRGITPTLLFVVYVLLLLACNAEIIASDENFKRVFDRTKKVYDIAKNNASVEGINLYNFEYDKKCKTVIFVIFGFLLVALACNTLHADKKSYIGVADFHRIVLYDYYISFGSLELSGNKKIKQNKNEVGM